jgi:hypothetical protein
MNNKIIPNIIAILSLIFFFSINQYAQEVKYPKLSEGKVVLEGDSGKWDYNHAHTFSVVEANKDGYKYWGYYGLSFYGGDPALRKAGLARSNDLVHWDKYDGNPIIQENCRWPNVVLVNSKFYMFYAEYNSDNDSRIVMLTSNDGLHFENKVVVVPFEKGNQNQNPFIFHNKQDGCFYLAYYSGIERSKDPTENLWQIKLRKSKTINKLNEASAKTLLASKDIIAAPSITFLNNKYFLLIESYKAGKWDNKWVTLAYESNKIDGEYKEVSNNPVLFNNDPCAFQHIFNNQLYIFYSHCLDTTDVAALMLDWEIKMVKAIK